MTRVGGRDQIISAGSNSLQAIGAHLVDLQRGGNRLLEIDAFCEPVVGEAAARALIDDLDLDLNELYQRQPHLAPTRQVATKLVHKILFSMPRGTPPDLLLAAVRNFGRAEFAGRHRYALALHTDEPHPHVHMVLNAMTENLKHHLNIRKPILQRWRSEFAHHLRALGVSAQASRSSARRRTSKKLPGIYRPGGRGSGRAHRHVANRARQLTNVSPPVQS